MTSSHIRSVQMLSGVGKSSVFFKHLANYSNRKLLYKDYDNEKFYPYPRYSHLKKTKEDIVELFESLELEDKLKTLSHLSQQDTLVEPIKSFFDEYKNKKEYKLRLIFIEKQTPSKNIQ